MSTSLPQGEEGGGTYDEYFGEIPPESTEFGWPLYITVPFTEYDNGRIYLKEDDALITGLWQWCDENKELLYDDFFQQGYISYPPELYINGVKVDEIYNVYEFGQYMNSYAISSRWYEMSFDDYRMYIRV